MKNKCHLSNPAWDPVLPRVLSDWLVLKVTRLLIGPTLPGPPSLSPRIKNPEWSRLRGYKSIAPGFITVSVDSLSCGAILGFTKAKSETQWSLRVTVGTVGTVDKRWSGKFYAVSQPSCGKSQSTLPVLNLGKGSQKWSFYYLTLF